MHVLSEFPPSTGATSATGRGSVGSGSCTRCGTDRKKRHPGVVDIDVQFFGEGLVVLCWSCAQEIGALTGMATPEKVAKYEQRIAELEARVEAQAASLAAVAHLKAALDVAAGAAQVEA